MKPKLKLNHLLTLLITLMGTGLSAQEQGIDQQINDAFMPIAVAWENLVLTTIPIGAYNVPIVLILLITGALFFTIYFKVL